MLPRASCVPRPRRPLGTAHEPLTSHQQAPRCHYGRPRSPHHGPRGNLSPPLTAEGPRVNPDLLLRGPHPREGRELLTKGSPTGPAHQEEAVTGQQEAGRAQLGKEARLTPAWLGSRVTGGPCRVLTDPQSAFPLPLLFLLPFCCWWTSIGPLSSRGSPGWGRGRPAVSSCVLLGPGDQAPASIGGFVASPRPLPWQASVLGSWRGRRPPRRLALDPGPHQAPVRLPRKQVGSGRRGATSPAIGFP